jgi:hypothetical protein
MTSFMGQMRFRRRKEEKRQIQDSFQDPTASSGEISGCSKSTSLFTKQVQPSDIAITCFLLELREK